MRTAICLSGLPRGLLKCLPSIMENIIIPNECDVFVHTWFDPNTVGQLYRNRHPKFLSKVVDKTDELIWSMYKPVRCFIEPQKEFDVGNYFSVFQPHDTYFIKAIQSMFYSMQQCNNLKKTYELENGFKYDAVCRLRFDLLIFEPIIFKNLDLTKINIPHDCKHEENCCTDHIGISSSNNMDVYSNTYSIMQKFYDDGARYCAEIFLGRWLAENNISLTDGGFNYSLLERV